MMTIEIDFDVFKALTLRRENEKVTYNDVLRGLLGFAPSEMPQAAQAAVTSQSDWISKGVHFPSGTEFRATYKGQTFSGKVEGGALSVNGKGSFDSPSAAAMAITSKPVNGWIFWECRLPGKTTWQVIKSLRK